MVSKKSTQPVETKTSLLVPLTEAKDKLSVQIDRGKDLSTREITSQEQLKQARDDYYTWTEFVTELLQQLFSTNQPRQSFVGISSGVFGGSHIPLQKEIESHQDDVRYKLRKLKSIYDKLELYPVVVTGKPQKPSSVAVVENCLQRFHLVARQLRNRYNDRPTLDTRDEYDVQNLLHSLLHLFFDDIRPEEWGPSYAGGSSRMDFLLKSEQVVVEAKMGRKGLGSKQVGEQLLIDIGRYQTHPDCKTLICFIYDPDGYINNPRGLENDLSKSVNSMIVKVFVYPK